MISKIIKWMFVGLFILAVGYSLFGIGHFKWMYHTVNNPKAEFLISGSTTSKTNLIIFTTYPCGYCKNLYPIMKELKEVRKDIRFATHPIGFDSGETRRLTEVVFASGLQGKFSEMHEALMEHPLPENETDIVSEDFINETASLYGIDTDQLTKDRKSKKVKKMVDRANKALNHAGIQSVPSYMINDKVYVVDGETTPELKDFLELITNAEQ